MDTGTGVATPPSGPAGTVFTEAGGSALQARKDFRASGPLGPEAEGDHGRHPPGEGYLFSHATATEMERAEGTAKSVIGLIRRPKARLRSQPRGR